MRQLQTIHFTLIDPKKADTDRFVPQHEIPNLHTHCTIYNIDIKTYLQKHSDSQFDIIYFEQPDLSAAGILLAKVNFLANKFDISLRESIPFLKKVIKPNTLILGSCLFRHDLTQLNSLIRFSLQVKTRLVYLPGLFANGTPYCSGLVTVVNPNTLPTAPPEKIEKRIKKNDALFCLLLAASIMVVAFTTPWAKLLSFFFTLGLFFYHRYGWRPLMIKLSLLACQMLILALA